MNAFLFKRKVLRRPFSLRAMISIFTRPAKIIGAGLSTFGLAGARAGKLYMKETSNFYIKNYIRLNSYIRNVKKKYRNSRILITFVDIDILNKLLVELQILYTFLENYPYILLFL